MRKIVFIANQFPPYVVGGAELTVQTLADELMQRGIRVVVISLARDSVDSQDEVHGLRVYRVAVSNIYAPFKDRHGGLRRLAWHLRDMYDSRMAAKVGAIIDIERPDAVSTHNLGGFSVAVWSEIRARGLPLIHTVHDYYLLCPRTSMFRGGKNCATPCLSCRVLSMSKRTASKQVDIVIGVSRFVLDTHLSRGYFPQAKSAVLYNSRPAHTPPTRIPDRACARQPLRIGFLGRVEEPKGIEVLLSAAARLPPHAWTLQVGGRPADPAYLRHLRNRYPLPQVNYLGFIQPESFYPTIDVLVLPSKWHEPLGVVIIEAMGYGVPTIASRSGGIPEMIEGSGAGYLFEPGNIDELAMLLQGAIEARERLDAMRPVCLERRRYFLPQRQASEFLDIIGWS